MYDDLDTIASNSFLNFHAKGLHYLCLKRSPSLTLKAYFYNTDKLSPEIVCPHDHRYNFWTQILAGGSEHIRYSLVDGTPTHERFEWRTPLLGGKGFNWSNSAALKVISEESYWKGAGYSCDANEVHTIKIREPDTILLLVQLADVVPVHEPTSTFVPGDGKEPPSLAGLYDKMPLADAESLLRKVNSAIWGNQ